MFIFFYKKKYLLVCNVFLTFFLLLSCEDTQSGAVSDAKKDFASQVLYNAKIIQRDSGKVSVRINAPLIEKYEYLDTPYVETRKGIHVEFTDKKNSNKPSKMWADYAKMIEKTGFYEAKGNVKIINSEGQTFKMKSLYWDKNEGKMHTKDTVYITDKEGNILIGSGGMNAKDDFSEYSLYKSFGEANAKTIQEAE